MIKEKGWQNLPPFWFCSSKLLLALYATALPYSSAFETSHHIRVAR
jgi:hypothetical protein